MNDIWVECVNELEKDREVFSQQMHTWIKTLQPDMKQGTLFLFAPNGFIKDWVKKRYLDKIKELLFKVAPNEELQVQIEIGSRKQERRELRPSHIIKPNAEIKKIEKEERVEKENVDNLSFVLQYNNLNPEFTFDSFVEGKSNQLALAAAQQVSRNPGGAYNPLFIYGGVGLGKTHLMHAVGNMILKEKGKENTKVVYMHSERFVADMVKALQSNKINEFKQYYRGVDALLIDDIQFFAKKERSQEEFFHTFNALLEGQRQVIVTCDRYPKEIMGVEERLKSRFGWGLTVEVEPPELETRVAILMSKAEKLKANLTQEVAFLVAKKIKSNVRELEGVLKRISANAQFSGSEITVDFVCESLKDLFAAHDNPVLIDDIQRAVADYFQIRVVDILSKRRSRSVSRPRQLAMYLTKELTGYSLAEIGEAFDRKDHTTVMHACKVIEELCRTSTEMGEAYQKLIRILTG